METKRHAPGKWNILKIAKEAAQISKGLNFEAGLNSEYVAIWKDGSVTMPDCGTEARGDGNGWEYPVCVLRTPHRIADVVELLRRARVEFCT